MSCGLRDVLTFEAAELPAVLVASAAFTAVADSIAPALGQPDVRRVFVPHPIADRTDEEMYEIARRSVQEIVAALS